MSAPSERDEQVSWPLAVLAMVGFVTSAVVAPALREDVIELAERLATVQDGSSWVVAGWAISWAPPLYVATVLVVGAGRSLVRLEWSVVHIPVLMVLSAAMFAVLVPAVSEGSRPMDTREDFARWFPRVPDDFYEASSSFPVVLLAGGALTVVLGAAFASADRVQWVIARSTPVIAGCGVWVLALGTLSLMLLV